MRMSCDMAERYEPLLRRPPNLPLEFAVRALMACFEDQAYSFVISQNKNKPDGVKLVYREAQAMGMLLRVSTAS